MTSIVIFEMIYYRIESDLEVTEHIINIVFQKMIYYRIESFLIFCDLLF